MVFVFECNRPEDTADENPAIPFRFLEVLGAALVKDDWQYSGRSETSRRTITASVKRSGLDKLNANWIYRAGLGGPLAAGLAWLGPPIVASGVANQKGTRRARMNNQMAPAPKLSRTAIVDRRVP